MSKLYCVFIIILLTACTKNKVELDTSIPICIQEILNDPVASLDIKTIRVQQNNGELHYWLNTDFTHFDGVEYIVNMDCDTVCSFCGECIPPECTRDYKDAWEVIWE